MTDHEDAPKKPHARAGDAEVLALAESLFSALGKTFDRGDLEILKTVVESYPDVGRDGAGDVTASLNGLIDDFIATRAYDKQAIAVHVRAWRFMVSRRPDKVERARVLSGLRAVREHYATT
jgi:hypothetical protein